MKFAKCLVFIVAVGFTAVSAESELTALNGHDFWKQLTHGFRGLEEAALKLAGLHRGDQGDAQGGDADSAPSEGVIQDAPPADSKDPDGDKSSEESSEEDDDLDFDIGLPGPADDLGLANGFFGPLFNFGNFANNMVWWKGPNVCVTREEVDETQRGERGGAGSEHPEDDEHGAGGLFPDFHFSSCSQTLTKYECVSRMSNHGILKKFVTQYRCCHGARREFGKPGCTQVELSSLLETARGMGGEMFARMLSSAGLEREVSAAGNATLFVPTDDAMRDYIDGMQDQNRVRRALGPAPAGPAVVHVVSDDESSGPQDALEVTATPDLEDDSDRREQRGGQREQEPSREENQVPQAPQAPQGGRGRSEDPRSRELADLADRTLVLAHRVDALLDLHEARNDAVLNTSANTTLRLNVYPGPLGRTVTANCARITKDMQAVGGLVHLVDQVLKPVPAERTLAVLLEEDPRLSTVRRMVQNAGMMDALREAGPMTIFLPSDEAFRRMDREARANLMQEDACVGSFIRHLFFKHTICSAAAALRVKAPNVAGEYVTLERTATDDGKLLLEGAELEARDIMASNGVLHILHSVVLPDSARPLRDLLQSRNMTRWHDLLERADLLRELKSNVTLFVPSAKALQTPEAELLLSNRDDKDALRNILQYHVAHPALEAGHMSNDQLLPSHLQGNHLRINLYTTLPFLSGAVTRATVQCGRMVSVNNKACGAVLHEVDKVLSPPSATVLDLLDRDEFSTLRAIIKASSFEKQLASAEEPHFTFLAPTNAGFEKLDAELLKQLKSEQKVADSFMQRHILPSSLCCSGVGETTWPFTNRVATLSRRETHPIRRDSHSRIHIGDAVVQQCDKIATNGIVHVLDVPLIPSMGRSSVSLPNRRQNPNVEILLFGL